MRHHTIVPDDQSSPDLDLVARGLDRAGCRHVLRVRTVDHENVWCVEGVPAASREAMAGVAREMVLLGVPFSLVELMRW